MLAKSSLVQTLLLLGLGVPLAAAKPTAPQQHSSRQSGSSSSSSGTLARLRCRNETEPHVPFQFGPDQYPPAATIGWNFNHVSLNVGNLTASIDFYTRVLGMRLVFTHSPVPYFKMVYLGHPSGGRNGTAYQKPQEVFRMINNIQGLIELIYFAPDATNPPRANPVPSTVKTNTLSHIGLIVPDVHAAQARFKAEGVNILKEWGQPWDLSGPLPRAFGGSLLPPGNEALYKEVVEALGPATLGSLMISDPDGNLIEVLPVQE